MSLEQRVQRLESHFDSLDGAVRSLIKITGETHKIILENQKENRLRFQQIERRLDMQDKEIAALKADVSVLKSDVSALTKATFAGFKRSDEQLNEFKLETRERFDQLDAFKLETRERFDQLEMLIRQCIPAN